MLVDMSSYWNTCIIINKFKHCSKEVKLNCLRHTVIVSIVHNCGATVGRNLLGNYKLHIHVTGYLEIMNFKHGVSTGQGLN